MYVYVWQGKRATSVSDFVGRPTCAYLQHDCGCSGLRRLRLVDRVDAMHHGVMRLQRLPQHQGSSRLRRPISSSGKTRSMTERSGPAAQLSLGCPVRQVAARPHCCSTSACLCVCRSWDRCLVSVDQWALHGFFSLGWIDQLRPRPDRRVGNSRSALPCFPAAGLRNARKGGHCTAHGTKGPAILALQSPAALLSSSPLRRRSLTRSPRSRRGSTSEPQLCGTTPPDWSHTWRSTDVADD